ncbi:MAG: hypothetical protein ACLFPO_02835 [Spirochaetaceae bacterium]
MKSASTAALGCLASVILASWFLVSCTSGPPAQTVPADAHTAPPRIDPATALLYDTAPRDGIPLFVGFSPRLRDRDAEEEAAVLDAAEEAVRYLEVEVSVVFISRRSGRGVGYAEAVKTRIDRDRAAEIRDGLELVETYQDGRGTVVIVAAPELPELPELAGIGPLWDTRPAGESPPGWIGERRRIPGYDTGVGVAARRRSRSDSVTAADEEALAEIVLDRAARIRAVGERRSIDGVGTTERTTRSQETADVVRGFYVLSRWRSPDERYYYSLAVARRNTEASGE